MNSATNANDWAGAVTRREREQWAARIEREEKKKADEIRYGAISKLPGRYQKKALSEFEYRCKVHGETEANRWILSLGELTNGCSISPDANDMDICDLAKQKALQAAKLTESFAKVGRMGVRHALERMCVRSGVQAPKERLDDAQAIVRVCDEMWWRPRLRRLHGRQSESLARQLGYVHEKAGKYCSNEALSRREYQNRRNRTMLESTEIVSEDGEIITLAQAYDAGMSNKALRRAELMTRAKGCEDVAIEKGHQGVFVTMTCPSRMHARHFDRDLNNVLLNAKHDGSTPADSHAYLQRNWERIRAKLDRINIRPYGLRIAEPHHDGTAHWHMLLFVEQSQKDDLVAVMHHYAMQESPNEPGASKHRFKVEVINAEKGSAIGYLVKYVCKNVDGAGMEVGLDGIDPTESAQRAEAWATAHGIRQFQAFGVPGVSVWRELRRVPEKSVEGAPDAVQIAHEAAQKTEDAQADFGKFIKACGGVGLKRSDYLLTVAKEETQIQGRYGFTTVARPVGVALSHARERVFRSDRRVWTPLNRSKSTRVATPWTCVNNCTHKPEQSLSRYGEQSKGDEGGCLPGLSDLTQRPRISGVQKLKKRKGSDLRAPAQSLPSHRHEKGSHIHGLQ